MHPGGSMSGAVAVAYVSDNRPLHSRYARRPDPTGEGTWPPEFGGCLGWWREKLGLAQPGPGFVTLGPWQRQNVTVDSYGERQGRGIADEVAVAAVSNLGSMPALTERDGDVGVSGCA